MSKEKKEVKDELADTLKSVSEVGEGGGVDKKVSFDPIPAENCIKTPCTLLNIALSNNTDGGIVRPSMTLLHSESGVGKSVFALSLCAEAYKRGDMHIEFFDKENSIIGFDFPRMFGIPNNAFDIINSENSAGRLDSLERTFLYILKQLEDGKSHFFVIDSLTAYMTDAQLENLNGNISTVMSDLDKNKTSKLQEDRLAGVASVSSKYLGIIKEKLAVTKSILIVTQQWRDNIGAMPAESKVRVGGGKCVRYSTDYVLVLKKGKIITKTAASGRVLEQGYNILFSIQKNRSTGLSDTLQIPYLKSTGFRDSKSLVQYLIETKDIAQSGAYYSAPWLTGSDKKMYEKDLRIFIRDTPGAYELLKQRACDVYMNDLRSVYEDY